MDGPLHPASPPAPGSISAGAVSPGEGEEHVVEVRGVHRERPGSELFAVDAVEHRAERGQLPVAGHLEGERLLVASRVAEDGRRPVETLGIVELQPDPPARDEPLEFGGGAVGHHVSLIQHGDLPGEHVRLLQVLGGEQDGRPGGDELADDHPHLCAAPGIETGGRFVQEDDLRAVDQTHGQVEAPAHPSGIGRERLASGIGELESLEQLLNPFAAVSSRQVSEPGHQQQVLLAGQDAVHRGELSGQTDQAPDGGWLADDIVTTDPRGATVRPEQGGKDVHDRGLSGAVGSEQRKDATGGDVEVDVVQHDLVAESFGERFDLDGRWHGAPFSWVYGLGGWNGGS